MTRVVLTGATGVVGSAILRALGDHHTLVLSRDPSRVAQGTNISALACDLASIPSSLADEITRFKPGVFIHAGWHGSENSQRNSPDLIQLNVKASKCLLEMAADAGCRHWIEFGSQAEYSPDIEIDITEDAATSPDTAYGAAKILLRTSAEAFCERAGMHFSWLRLFTCYGREYKPSYVIPYLISTLRKGEVPQLRTPHAVWDCLYADDAAQGVMSVMKHAKPEGIYNLAYGKGTSVGEMALIIAGHLQFPAIQELRAQITAGVASAPRRVADISKFSQTFNWRPQIDIREGLAKCL